MAARARGPAPKPARGKPSAAALVTAGEGGRLVACVDLLIERADLGPGCATLISAGDPLPPDLTDLPRRKRP
jgi:hypothetical protein